MSLFVFVDNSNVWIEGQYASAVAKGQAANIAQAHRNNQNDFAWRIDYGKLLTVVTNNRVADVKCAVLFGSRPPENDSLWNAMRNVGFDVVIQDRNVVNKEKAVDTGIVIDIGKRLYREANAGDEFILVMGDKDFLPAVEAIHQEGCKCTVAFWKNVSGELKSAADNFLNLSLQIASVAL